MINRIKGYCFNKIHYLYHTSTFFDSFKQIPTLTTNLPKRRK